MTSIKGRNFRPNGLTLIHYPPEVQSFYRGHKVLTLGLYFYNIGVTSLMIVYNFPSILQPWQIFPLGWVYLILIAHFLTNFVISQPQTIDPLLRVSMGDFLSTITDVDLNVRRVALVAFNSAAHNKPSLIRDLLHQVLPHLYAETKVRVSRGGMILILTRVVGRVLTTSRQIDKRLE